MKIWRKRLTHSLTELINELINDEAVYRTALATPGLLNMYLFSLIKQTLSSPNIGMEKLPSQFAKTFVSRRDRIVIQILFKTLNLC